MTVRLVVVDTIAWVPYGVNAVERGYTAQTPPQVVVSAQKSYYDIFFSIISSTRGLWEKNEGVDADITVDMKSRERSRRSRRYDRTDGSLWTLVRAEAERGTTRPSAASIIYNFYSYYYSSPLFG